MLFVASLFAAHKCDTVHRSGGLLICSKFLFDICVCICYELNYVVKSIFLHMAAFFIGTSL